MRGCCQKGSCVCHAKTCITEKPARTRTNRHPCEWFPGRQGPIAPLGWVQTGKETSCFEGTEAANLCSPEQDALSALGRAADWT